MLQNAVKKVKRQSKNERKYLKSMYLLKGLYAECIRKLHSKKANGPIKSV